MSPQLCGTPMGLLCIMRCAWCASSCLILFFRTQNSSTSPFVTRAKASGEKREFTHHFSCVSHILTGVRKYLAPYIWKKLLFFLPPGFTLSWYKVNCANIFFSQWYLEREQGKSNWESKAQHSWPGHCSIGQPCLWKFGNGTAACFVLLQTVVISVTESSAQRQKLHQCLMLPSWDSSWVHLAWGTLLLFIMRTAEVKWNTRQLYSLN